jgi:thiosulfate/3-mercaptopyruvate sulfurtransferase
VEEKNDNEQSIRNNLHSPFQAIPGPNKLAKLKDMTQSNLEKTGAVVLDARGAARFKGEVKEPREGVRCGHIPESLNLPFQNLLKEDGSGLLETNDLQDQFDNLLPNEIIQNINTPIITSCGSGVSACILVAGLNIIGRTENVKVFDGSWTEYGMSDLPVGISYTAFTEAKTNEVGKNG